MKKYITTIPLQPTANLFPSFYDSMGNIALSADIETLFPIIVPIYNELIEGESIKVIEIITDYPTVEINRMIFEKQLFEITEERRVNVEIIRINTDYDESIESHVKLFSDIIESVNDGDVVSADITYGTKPTPLVLNSAMTYFYNCCDNITIDKVIYGRYDFGKKKAYIHDVSALLFIGFTANEIGHSGLSDPLSVMKAMLVK